MISTAGTCDGDLKRSASRSIFFSFNVCINRLYVLPASENHEQKLYFLFPYPICWLVSYHRISEYGLRKSQMDSKVTLSLVDFSDNITSCSLKARVLKIER